jgi:hypothetical protein
MITQILEGFAAYAAAMYEMPLDISNPLDCGDPAGEPKSERRDPNQVCSQTSRPSEISRIGKSTPCSTQTYVEAIHAK